MNINSGASYATSNNYVQNGTLVIGDINSNYGNGNNWNSNTAGLILECLDNTEIAIHDYGNRVVGAIQYLGNTTNQLIIGRDMGWGTISSIKLNGTVGIGTNNSEKFNLQVYGSKGITHTGPNLSLATIDSNAYTSSLYYNAFAGDTNIYSFWGVSINLNNGGVNPNGNTANARIPNTSSFTINQKSIGGTATSGFTTLFTVSQNGNVGIGITSPNTRLHVNSKTSSTGAISGYYFSNSTTITSNTIGDNTVCAQFESSVWSKTKFICSSDERIKKNIVDIDDDNALQKILNIKPKTYQYIDTVERGNDIVYGFIAQQIQEIIPEAVTVTKEIIPNIYICECSNNIITLPDNIISSNILNINDEIIIIDEINYERKSYIIQDIDNNKITIDNNLIGSNCFVYGTKVNDFHTLNKDYIFTLNVCATQDLYKIIQEQQKQINYLLSKINI